MPVCIMPPFPPNVLPDFIILLCLFHKLHIRLHDTHPLFRSHPFFTMVIPQRSNKRHTDSRQPSVIPLLRLPRRRTRIHKHHRTSILKRPRRKRALKEHLLAHWILLQSIRRAITERPKCRNNDDLCTTSDEFSKRFREGQIPTDQQADGAQGRLDRFMPIMRAAR